MIHLVMTVDSIDLMLCNTLGSTKPHWDRGKFSGFNMREIVSIIAFNLDIALQMIIVCLTSVNSM